MNPSDLKRIVPFILAALLIAFDSSTVRGQRDAEEMVFEPPKVAPTNAVRQANDVSISKPSTAKGTRAGKASVTQTSGTMPLKSPRTPIPGTEPKNLLAGKPMAPNVSTLPPAQVSMANPAGTPPVTTAAAGPTVTTASHLDPMQVINRDGGNITQKQIQRRTEDSMPMMSTPMDRSAMPAFRGSVLGLNGVPASEKLFQLQGQYSELERECDELRRQNAGLLSRTKESHDQLLAGVREIQIARKELTAARSDLDRLRNDLQTLREKVQMAEKEHSAVLQSIGPLLQQLLDSDDVSALPPIPMDRE